MVWVAVGLAAQRLTGTDQDDVIDGSVSDDEMHGERGDDRLNGGAGDDEIYGEDGNDVLTGNTGDDQLVGGRGNDELRGGAGNDTLIGGPGIDTLFGGPGADRFFASLPFDSADIVADFRPGEGDTVWIDFGQLRREEQGFPDKLTVGNFDLSTTGDLKIRLASGAWVELFNMKRGDLSINVEDFGREVRLKLTAQF